MNVPNPIITYNQPGDNLIQLVDEFNNQPVEVYVSLEDYNNNVFYEHSTGKVYAKKYKDETTSATSIFNSIVQTVQTEKAQELIQVNNVQYVSNIVQENITQSFVSAGFDDPSQALANINLNILALQSTAATMQSMLNDEKVIDKTQTDQIWTNSNLLASQQIQINKILSTLNNLSILSISNGTFTKNLN